MRTSTRPPRRRAIDSLTSRLSPVVLIVGSVVAGAAAFGPPPLVRLGVVAALLTAALSWVSLWHELRAERHRHAAVMLTAAQRAGRVLSEERRRNASVVDLLTGRVQVSAAALAVEQQANVRLQGEVTGLRGERARLRGELWHREADVAALQETVRSRDVELETWRAVVAARPDQSDGPDRSDGEAEVHTLPRRARSDHASEPPKESTAEFTAGAEVAALALEAPPSTPVMPNYEDDRRFA